MYEVMKKKMVNICFYYKYNVDTLFLVDDLKLFSAIINKENAEMNTEDNRIGNVYMNGNYIAIEVDITERTYRVWFTNDFISNRASIRALIKMYEK